MNAEWHRLYYAKTKEKRYAKKYALQQERLREIKNRFSAFLREQVCMDCGENDPIVFELDHRDPEQKVKSISDMLRNGHSWAGLELEIAKCDVVCANCHRRRTAKQFGWSR